MRPPPQTQIFPPVTQVHIASVCAATGDPSPLHLDDAFARAAGYKSVVVPGTLLLGWVGQYLEEWAGDIRNLKRWEIRFLAPVWPGEQIKLTGRIMENGGAEVHATTLDGRSIGLAKAEFHAT